MENTNNISVHGLPKRHARAVQDKGLLSSLLVKSPDPVYVLAMLVKAALFAADRALKWVPCVLCGAVPPTDWPDLALDPGNAGLHCAAHKAAFHSVCVHTYNCCEEPYDPDRDYEWRHPNEP